MWCENYKKLSEENLKILINYPENCRLDLLNKVYFHECDPMLAVIDNKLIKETFSNFLLLYEELEQTVSDSIPILYSELLKKYFIPLIENLQEQRAFCDKTPIAIIMKTFFEIITQILLA